MVAWGLISANKGYSQGYGLIEVDVDYQERVEVVEFHDLTVAHPLLSHTPLSILTLRHCGSLSRARDGVYLPDHKD